MVDDDAKESSWSRRREDDDGHDWLRARPAEDGADPTAPSSNVTDEVPVVSDQV